MRMPCAQSVLENFHASVAFRTLFFYADGAANFVADLPSEQTKVRSGLSRRGGERKILFRGLPTAGVSAQRLRSAVIELVLETDLASHFDFLTRFCLKKEVARGARARTEAVKPPTRRPPSLHSPSNASLTSDGNEASKIEPWIVARACIRCADIG